jgi:hypothetical protein
MRGERCDRRYRARRGPGEAKRACSRTGSSVKRRAAVAIYFGVVFTPLCTGDVDAFTAVAATVTFIPS